MLNILIGAPIAGILSAFLATVAEQLLAVFANIIFKKEIVLDSYSNLGFFLVAAAVIEECVKYFTAIYILRQSFGLKRFSFIFASLLNGLFFGLTETVFILMANGKEFQQIQQLGSDILFSLFTVILVHTLTALLIATSIASQKVRTLSKNVTALIPPIFIHLLVNFLIIQKGEFTNWLIGIAMSLTFFTVLSTISFNFKELD